jgi:hypothetical protein
MYLKGCVFVYVPRIAGRKISVERGVGSGWRRGGMDEDIYVFEDQGWYGLVALDGGYLLVYFLLDCDITSVSSEGYSGGCLSVTDGIFLTKKLYKVPGPDGR